LVGFTIIFLSGGMLVLLFTNVILKAQYIGIDTFAQ